MNGVNPTPVKNGSGLVHLPPSSSGGAVPKVKLRKKITSHPSQPLPLSPLGYRVHPQGVPQQLFSRQHHFSPTNSHFQSNIALTHSNGAPQSVCKNIPKNQLLFDWQSGEGPSSPRGSCRSRQTPLELYDSASDESVSQDNRHILPSNSFRGIFSQVNGSAETQPSLHLHRLRMNSREAGGSPPSEISSYSATRNNGPRRNSETGQRSTVDNKKINVPSSPDRAQVEQRLNQIQDYIKQTSSLIESYSLSGMEASKDTNAEFLVGVLKDLHDSEAKLRCMLTALDQIIMEDEVKSSTEASIRETASRLSALQEPQVNGKAFNAVAASTKSSDTRKQNEIKMKFEESLRQAEQALLIQKRSEAQEQLQEAQRARNILLAMPTSGCPVNSEGDSALEISLDEQTADAMVKNLQDVDKQLPAVRSNNQMLSKEGVHRSSPSKELSSRKRQPNEGSDATTYLKELLTGEEVKEQASSEGSAIEDAMDDYAEARAQVRLQGQIVQEKVAEINALRTQLDQAKSLLNLAQRRDIRSQVSGTNSADEAITDQAVNIQRQRIGDGDGDASSVTHVESRNKASSKQQLLDQERVKLGRLRALLTTVQEYRSSGLPVPEHILSEFGTELQSGGSGSTSPAHLTSSRKEAHEEDAAVEADIDEDDEPESAAQWNQQHLSLIESATMASELSQGLQQRAAQLQIERDGLAVMQRQLDGLFNQLQQHQPVEKTPEPTNLAASCTSAGATHASFPPLPGLRNAQEMKRADEVSNRRMEILSDLHNRWQQLQENIALDGDLSVKAAPVLSAAKSALNLLASHIIPEADGVDDYPDEWDHSRGQATPTRSEHTPYSTSRERLVYEGSQMSSAPSTLIRRKSATELARNQRAVWSSANVHDARSPLNNAESVGYIPGQPEDNPPIVSMPSPSPSILQQQTQEMKNRLAALSHSCQSLCVDGGTEGAVSSPALPLMSLPPPPPPAPASSGHDREAYYQQLLAAGQLQQHQVLLTAVNQCFHILKMQQNELVKLSHSVHLLASGPGAHALHGAHPGLLPSEEPWPSPSPAPMPAMPGPPALNNQVPPGNRTNNYWDNFRSYSRQNLLSTTAKSNEGLPHSPSPLVERSHNSLRSSTPMSVAGPPGPPAMSMSQFHSLSAPHCMPGVAPAGLVHAGGPAGLPPGAADGAGAPLGAVGPALPLAGDVPHAAPLVQNISRKDKRNIDHTDGGQGSPRRRASNEIDYRTASRVLEDAALPLNSQMVSPTSQEFEVPSMPILRNSVSGLQSRLNQINLNAPSSLVNLQDFMETHSTRQQLNNEGVPFSEISTSLSNSQVNEFGSFCSHDHTRESTRRLNMDYHNGTMEAEPTCSTVLKRNTGAIKRTYATTPNAVNSPTGFTSNYQRNIHSTPAVPHLSLSNSSSNTESSNSASKISSVFPISSSDSETVLKSSKQSGLEATRNFNVTSRQPALQEEFQISSSSTSASSRSRMHGINHTDDHQAFRQDEDTEYEDLSMLRSAAFNNCQSSTSSLSSSSQNTSNMEIPTFGPGKNQLKESCFQIRKGPKYQSKPGSRVPLSDTAAAAVAVASNSSPLRNVHSRPSSKSQTANWLVNKNNQDYATPTQMSGQGHLFEELRESVYAEMTSLISANGGKSHFLVQLLRDLQHISSDSVRQSVLQLIQQAVNRSQIDLGNVDLEGSFPLEDEAEEDEDEAKRIEMQRLPFAGGCTSSDLKGVAGSTSSTQEGETLMQLVLGLELAAVLSANSDGNCSPSLIEDIRSRIIQLIPVPHNSSLSSKQPSNSPRSTSYLHSQIDSVLESILLKFHGRRIGDVRNEITSCVVSALPIKLMYRSMVDYYSRNNMESEAHLRRDGSFRETTLSPSGSLISQNSLQFLQHNAHLGQDGRDGGLLTEASNGDLAEADQSHHSLNAIDGDIDSEADRDCSTEGKLSGSASTLLHVHVYQLSGASEVIDSEPEVEALQEDGNTVACATSEQNCGRNDPIGAVAGAVILTTEKSGRENVSASETWSLEQDCDGDDDMEDREREQGLDQVPTRLASDNDRDQENGEKHRSHHLSSSPNDPSSSS